MAWNPHVGLSCHEAARQTWQPYGEASAGTQTEAGRLHLHSNLHFAYVAVPYQTPFEEAILRIDPTVHRVL